IMMATKNGYLIRFPEDQVRSMGRNAAGVRGISLRDDDEVVSMEILDAGLQVLHVTNKGVGKRTPEDQYRVTKRGGKGIFTCKLSEGNVVTVKAVTGDEDIMLITIAGVLIRIPVKDVSETGRNTRGVRLIRLQDDEEVATVAKIDPAPEEDETVDDMAPIDETGDGPLNDNAGNTTEEDNSDDKEKDE